MLFSCDVSLHIFQQRTRPHRKGRIVLMIYDNIVLAADKWRRQICLLYFFRLKENPTFVKSLVSVIFLLKFNIFAGVTLLPPKQPSYVFPTLTLCAELLYH